jgi:membrane-bound lytic murein transglycosylase B
MDAAFRGAGFLPEVVEKDRNQTEFKRSLEDYLNIAASDERVSLGRQKYAQYAAPCGDRARYGVEAHVVAAVWGLESFYGTRRGNVPVISALSTLAYDGRRGEFFESQLTAALRILQAGDTRPTRWWEAGRARWAIRSSSRPAILNLPWISPATGAATSGARTRPTALASTAAYLRRSGWTTGACPGGWR